MRPHFAFLFQLCIIWWNLYILMKVVYALEHVKVLTIFYETSCMLYEISTSVYLCTWKIHDVKWGIMWIFLRCQKKILRQKSLRQIACDRLSLLMHSLVVISYFISAVVIVFINNASRLKKLSDHAVFFFNQFYVLVYCHIIGQSCIFKEKDSLTQSF